MAVALLARRPEPLQELTKTLRSQVPGSVIEAFPTDASKPDDIKKTFKAIKENKAFEGLKLDLAVFSVKHSSRKGFMEETYEEFTESLTAYVGGAFSFSQESLKRFFEDHGETSLAEGGGKKGVCFFPSLSPSIPNLLFSTKLT